jgi:hypothetical protein
MKIVYARMVLKTLSGKLKMWTEISVQTFQQNCWKSPIFIESKMTVDFGLPVRLASFAP